MRNDSLVLEVAREVFPAEPKAPIATLAERAGVGISALYRCYPSKETLLRTLCHEGLRRYNAEADTALAEPDGRQALPSLCPAKGAPPNRAGYWSC